MDPYRSERGRVQKSCGPDELLWNLEFRTDKYGYETSWKLERYRDVNGNDNAYVPVASGPPGLMKYAADTTYSELACLVGSRMYRLTVSDTYADGF